MSHTKKAKSTHTATKQHNHISSSSSIIKSKKDAHPQGTQTHPATDGHAKDTNSTTHPTTAGGAVPDRSKAHDTSSTDSALSPAAPHHAVCHNALLVLGTYHSVVAGVVLREHTFHLHFSVKYHVGCVHAVALSPRYLATSGADERLFLFTNKTDVRRRAPAHAPHAGRTHCPAATPRLASLGSLNPPAEVVTVAFAPAQPAMHSSSSSCFSASAASAGSAAQRALHSTHLIGGCADGQVVVYRTRDWGLAMPPLPVHTQSILALAVHPRSAGSLVVTIGTDRVVAVLDLARGRLLSRWKYRATGTRVSESTRAGAMHKRARADGCDDTSGSRHTAATGARATHRDATNRSGSNDTNRNSIRSKNNTKIRTSSSSSSSSGNSSNHPTNGRNSDVDKGEDSHAQPTASECTTGTAPSAGSTREQPIGLCFSPSGDVFAVFARFSLVVYHSLTLAVVCAHTLPHPQPHDELQACIFVNDNVLLLGNESGALLSFAISSCNCGEGSPADTTDGTISRNTKDRDDGDATRLCCSGPTRPCACNDGHRMQSVVLHYPDKSAMPGPSAQATHSRTSAAQHYRHHSCRIKAISRQGMTFFTVDSSGVIIAWDAGVINACGAAAMRASSRETDLLLHSYAEERQGLRVRLRHVASVNCKGRVTSMDSMAL